MMDQSQLEKALSDLSLGGIRYFERIDSTNDEAARWAIEGAGDFSLVVAADQTAGRGRAGRTWYTQPGASLAMSVILVPQENDTHPLSWMTALAALALQDALQKQYQLTAQIKWPNDILLHHRKVAGVLVEAHWTGNEMTSVVLGIGVNIAASSINWIWLHNADVFPATYLEAVLAQPVNAVNLVRAILVHLQEWRSRIASQGFLQEWEDSLAYRGEWVQILSHQDDSRDGLFNVEGRIIGLSPDGSLRLQARNGEIVNVHAGEVRLRPAQPYTCMPSIVHPGSSTEGG